MTAEVLTLIGVVIAAAASIVVALLNIHQNRQLAEIHVLVNDRLDAALAEIKRLEALKTPAQPIVTVVTTPVEP